MVVEPGRAAGRARGKVVAADHREIAGRAVAGAIARAPHAPTLLEGGWLGRRLEQLGIGEGDVVRQLFALGRKADGTATVDRVAAIDEGVEHDAEELVRQLERALAARRSQARPRAA